MTVFNSFLLTFIAGASTLIGTLFIFSKVNILSKALAFASGVMITVSLIDLIPEALFYLNSVFYKFPSFIIMLIFFNVGIIISVFIDKFIPKGNELYRVGIISMLVIILHNIPDD